MSINRQFSLPNCVFILEGFSNSSDAGVARPELSILTRFECYFAREKQALVGGLDLLESLISATNDSVQACISGVPSAHRKTSASSPRVEINPVNDGFELIVPEDLLSQGLTEPSKEAETAGVQMQISAVQLFDLMEAIDQLTADQQTLPTLQNVIRSRSRSQTLSGSVLVEKSAPVALGAASVAAAAAAFFLVPAPKVPAPKPQSITSPLVQPSAVPSTAVPSVVPSVVPPSTPSSTLPSPPTGTNEAPSP